jgi:hypothetical protein
MELSSMTCRYIIVKGIQMKKKTPLPREKKPSEKSADTI